MASGYKTIATKPGRVGCRGALLICAARRRHRESLALLALPECQAALKPLANGDMFGAVTADDLRYGQALALVDAVDCLPVGEIPAGFLESEGKFDDFSEGRFGLVTRNLQLPSAPFAVAGRGQLFETELPGSITWQPYTA